MSAVVDTSVLVDFLRGHAGAAEVLQEQRSAGPLHASEITRVELLAGMRSAERARTRSLLSALRWHAVDAALSEIAGELGREWLPGHRNIDAADLVIAATAQFIGLPLLTLNVRHFPMFPGLRPPY